MKLSLMLEADRINVQALNMGRIIVDVDGVNLTELINKVAENGYSLRVVEESDQQSTCTLNRPGFPGECFICELRLPDHRFRWK
ncbi:DUF5983 family protein, partial [Escherichia coli]|nr:DUF5983 family protein [Escherichia coli]